MTECLQQCVCMGQRLCPEGRAGTAEPVVEARLSIGGLQWVAMTLQEHLRTWRS